jgi:hypothetical protein
MRSSTNWTLAILLIVLAPVLTVLGVRWLFHIISRKYRGLALVAFFIFLLIASFATPTRDPAYRRSRQVVLVVLLAVLGPMVAIQVLRRPSRGRMFREWIKDHGFALASESRTSAKETLSDSLRRLPLFRRGDEPATQYVLKRNEGIQGPHTIVFDYETWRKNRTPWWLTGGFGESILRVTVIAIRRGKLRLPAFELRPAPIAEQPLDDDPPWLRVELPEQPRFAERYTLYGQDPAELERIFSHDLVNTLERDPTWCLEGLGEWFIAYRNYTAEGFWSMRPSGLEFSIKPDELSAWLKTAHHLFRIIEATLE